jgi:lipopolysaccharide export system protein LptA
VQNKIVIIAIITTIINSNALELINANTNSNKFENGTVVSTLSGNVEFLWNETRIFSDKTIWKRGEGHLLMSGNIKVLRNKQELKCDFAEFRSKGKVLQLKGKVFAVDTNYCATMTAGTADYFINNDSVFLTKCPKIYFWDSISTDTFTIAGNIMNYTSKTGIARAADSVKINGADFVSFADSGYYFADDKKGMLTGNPRIEYENSSVKGDTIHILFGETSLNEFFVIGNPVANSSEDENGDSTFMELIGDTLRFLIQDQKISQILSEKNSSFKRFKKDKEDVADKMQGERILTFLNNKDIENYKMLSIVEGNAKAIYFDQKTKNESSGDTLKLFFDDDGVNKIIILGKVKGRVEE